MTKKTLMSLLAALVLAACAHTPRVDDAPFVLLGEVHDNPAHHAQRAALLRRLLADGRPTTVVFEQMDRAQDAAIAAAPREAQALIGAGRLDQKGWRWPLHKPVVDAALAGGARIVGGNLAREDVRRIVREGAAAQPAGLVALQAKTPWPAAQQQALEQEIEAAHCGALPDTMHAPMALAQRARDASMAQAMLDARAAGAARVVLIAGNGHVRRDRGVPIYLEAAGVRPGEIFSEAWIEDAVEPGRYDASVRTATAEREDPCESLKPASKEPQR